jgi:hypothetical protein
MPSLQPQHSDQTRHLTQLSVRAAPVQRHSVSINRAAPVTGMSTINPQQASVLAALNVKKPAIDAQLSLL